MLDILVLLVLHLPASTSVRWSTSSRQYKSNSCSRTSKLHAALRTRPLNVAFGMLSKSGASSSLCVRVVWPRQYLSSPLSLSLLLTSYFLLLTSYFLLLTYHLHHTRHPRHPHHSHEQRLSGRVRVHMCVHTPNNPSCVLLVLLLLLLHLLLLFFALCCCCLRAVFWLVVVLQVVLLPPVICGVWCVCVCFTSFSCFFALDSLRLASFVAAGFVAGLCVVCVVCVCVYTQSDQTYTQTQLTSVTHAYTQTHTGPPWSSRPFYTR
jgi:hypothetical protein